MQESSSRYSDSACWFQFTAAYVEALRAGHRETTEHFVRYFSRPIARKAQRHGWSRPTIEDLQQETFARVFNALQRGTLKRPERLGAFVVAVARNVVHEHIRNLKRGATRDQDHSPDNRPGPEALAHASDLRQTLSDTMAKLTETDRKLISMSVIDELSQEEICLRMSIKRSSLPVMLHRAKSRLRKRLTSELNAVCHSTYTNRTLHPCGT